MPVPPAGRYEFLSIPSMSGSLELIACSARQGTLYWWSPAAGCWSELEQLDGGLLADAQLGEDAWSCEIAGTADGTPLIFVPTGSGLACIRPELLRLGYHVDYAGAGSCIGAPLRWREEVWVPLRAASSCVRLQSVDPATGLAGSEVEVEGVATDEIFAPPACVRRQAIWPGRYGRIVLEVLPDGSLAADYLCWPPAVTPRYCFGAPYLSREGQLWQACWDDADERYVYLRLDGKDSEKRGVLAPRTCTGTVNYRFSTRMKLPPWDEPEHGSDAHTSALFVPIVESPADASVLGVHIDTAEGLEVALTNGERIRAVLELHSDRDADTRLFTINVPTPWLGRTFVHERTLWFYHPELRQLAGWELK